MGKFSIEKTRQNAALAIKPISKPKTKGSNKGRLIVFKDIPHHEYYLIYMLLADLLGFDYWGPGEKLAYAIPVEWKGRRHTIVYAKFGMRIEYFEGGDGAAVYGALQRGIKAAKPYYSWRADQASATSNLNLVSKCPELWEKYVYLQEQSNDLAQKFEAEKDHFVREEGRDDEGNLQWSSISWPAHDLRQQAYWMHETTVDAFFAWCEQALVHLAVLMGRLVTGKEIASLLKRDFREKCKLVFDLSDPKDKFVYDDILHLREQVRNYVAHGSFGKDGSTFQFHTKVGAVPLNVSDSGKNSRFSFASDELRDWGNDYARIECFLAQLWSGERLPAKKYIESGLPCILTYAKHGQYLKAMESEYDMDHFIGMLSRHMDDAANMDF